MAEPNRHGVGGLAWRIRRGSHVGSRRLRIADPGADFDETPWGDHLDDLRDDDTQHIPDDDTPLDTTRLHADDALLNRVSMADSDFVGTEAELTSLLLSWRRDVDAEIMPELVSTDEAVRRIADSARARRHHSRFLIPLATAAAVLVIAFTGVGLVARDAQPGDALWGLTQVLYSDHAHSVEAADTVRAALDHASQALREGHIREARNDLAVAQASLPAVASEDGQASLQQQGQQLLAAINAVSATTQPSAPSTQAGVPPVAASTTVAPPPSTTPPASTTTTPPPATTTTPPPATTTTPPPSSTAPQSSQATTGATGDDSQSSSQAQSNASPSFVSESTGSGSGGSSPAGTSFATGSSTIGTAYSSSSAALLPLSH